MGNETGNKARPATARGEAGTAGIAPGGTGAGGTGLGARDPRGPTLRRRQLMAAGLGLSLAPCVPAWAQPAGAWPDRPVRFLLSQPSGSGPDNVARLLGDRLGKGWSQPVVIDNRPGGQNVIGAQAAARAPADGYNFYFATTAALVTNAYLFKQLPYEPLRDFVPVAFVARSPFGIVVDGNSPIRTLDDLIARAKAQPGRVTLGNEGPRTFGGMIARLFAARAALDLNLVAYNSIGAGVQNVLGGQIEASIADIASTAQLIRQGRLRLVATTSAKRVAGWEQVPALAERLPGFEMVGWFALVAPAGTPAAAIARMNRDLNGLLADREVAEKIAAFGPMAEPGLDPEQVGAFLRAEHAQWAQIAREIGILPE